MTWTVTASMTLTTEDIGSVVSALRARRRELGLRQLDVAEAIGCDQRDLSYLENGHHQRPSPEVLQGYAQAVGATLTYTLTIPVEP